MSRKKIGAWRRATPRLSPMESGNDSPELSVVVLLTHDGDQARRCLNSIDEHVLTACSTEVVLILNRCSEAVRSAVADSGLAAKVIDCDVNIGTAVGWNLAFANARAERILLMHEDAEASAGMVRALTDAMDADPRIAVAGPLTGNTLERPTVGGWLLFKGDGQCALDPALCGILEATSPVDVDYVSSAISMWDSSSWRAIGGFDERRYPAVGVEVDACTGLWARGLRVVTAPSARGLHKTKAMDDGTGPLRGEHLRWFLFSQASRLRAEKWHETSDWYLDSPSTWPADLELVRAGLRRCAERAQAGVGIADPPSSERPLSAPTGGAPTTSPTWPLELTPSIRERVIAAERETIAGYCSWLVDELADRTAEMNLAREWIAKLERELKEIQAAR